VIAGREEARLIYLGVSQGVSGHEQRRLVIDIGGGSTELVIGEGSEPLEMESIQYGCVSLTRLFFGDGKLNRDRWQKAIGAAQAELQELRVRYRETGWDSAIGSSGTVRAAASICQAMGWCERDITHDALERLRQAMIDFGTIDAVVLPGLTERRHPVLAGGVAMLIACFEALKIERMLISPFALREGVLHDLLGRQQQRDPRDNTVKAFKARYAVDPPQVKRVKGCALTAFEQIAPVAGLNPALSELLGWAADLHETGLSVSHSQYQKHSGYLVEQSDMAGFTRQEQLFVAALVRYHRRNIPRDIGDDLPARLQAPLRMTLFCLRLAWVLSRSRDDKAIPGFKLDLSETLLTLQFDHTWAANHPLTVADLEAEKDQLQELGLDLEILNNAADGSP
jgi:exopolyphosphatase/guanosine-5'-triphosphate,3'-diphosphate pyrophosphatase